MRIILGGDNLNRTLFGHSVTFISQDWDSHPEFTHRDKKIGDYDSDKDIPIQTRLHIDKNTWENWGLVPSSRPTIVSPTQKRTTSDISNMVDGELDLSLSLLPYPVFSTRQGSLEFIYNPLHILVYKPQSQVMKWEDLQSEIYSFIHGKRLRMILEDDPNHYYEGTFSVDNMTSNTDGSGSVVTINYILEPYKLNIFTTKEIDDTLTEKIYSVDLKVPNRPVDSGGNTPLYNIITTHDKSALTNYFTLGSTEANQYTNTIQLFGNMGQKPQIPVIWFFPSFLKFNGNTLNSDDEGLQHNRSLIVNYMNYGFGINYGARYRYKYFDPAGSHGQNNSISSPGVELLGTKTIDGNTFYLFRDTDMIFGDNYFGEHQYIQFLGAGSFTSGAQVAVGQAKIDFRKGEL